MADLTASLARIYSGVTRIGPQPVAASAQIYQGMALEQLATGVVQAMADTAGSSFAGFADEEVLGGAAAGDVVCRTIQDGETQLTVADSGSSAVSAPVYASDSNTFTVTVGSLNQDPIGHLYRQISTTTWIVRFEARSLHHLIPHTHA